MRPSADRDDMPREWLRYARADLATARAPLPPDGLYEILCFHAQQAAEKSIKAVLVLHGIEPPRSHILDHLVAAIPPGVGTPADLDQAALLNLYAVTTRYPNIEDDVTEEEYLGALRLAEAVVAWAEREVIPPSGSA